MTEHMKMAEIKNPYGNTKCVYLPDSWPKGAEVTVVWDEPDTEKVPWHEAVGRRVPSGDTIVQVSAWNSGSQGYWLARHGETQFEVSGGLVEVLVERDRYSTVVQP